MTRFGTYLKLSRNRSQISGKCIHRTPTSNIQHTNQPYAANQPAIKRRPQNIKEKNLSPSTSREKVLTRLPSYRIGKSTCQSKVETKDENKHVELAVEPQIKSSPRSTEASQR